MYFIDTHTHYYDAWFGDEGPDAIRRSMDSGVGMMLQADTGREEREAMFALGAQFPEALRQMAGLYPGNVREDWKEELDALLPYLDRDIVAIGEIGLDYHEGIEYKDLQKEVLRIQFELAAQRDLPVNIHLRDAWEDFLGVLKDCRHLHLRGNLHCFSGSVEIYEKVQEYADFSIGVGGVVTFKNARLAGVVARVPLERILLETDCPYLAPVPHRGMRNESAYLPLIAAKIAEIKGIGLEAVRQATTGNARKLFRL